MSHGHTGRESTAVPVKGPRRYPDLYHCSLCGPRQGMGSVIERVSGHTQKTHHQCECGEWYIDLHTHLVRQGLVKPKAHQERTALARRDGVLKRLHVDQRLVRQDLPAITIQTSKGSIKASRVKVLGSSEFVHRPDDPLSCGARLWIETRAALEFDEVSLSD